jgi:preprotein translocase subunit YajC
MTSWLLLLAQATGPAVPPTGGPAAPPPGPFSMLLQFMPIILMLVVFWWIMSRGRNKERQRYEQMLNSLKKNDRVQTIGGLLGTVVEVRDHEVVLKVDESNNVKMRFNRTAIKEVLTEPEAK